MINQATMLMLYVVASLHCTPQIATVLRTLFLGERSEHAFA